jgi:hypothetical protein
VSLHLRRGFARTIGDALLHHLYTGAGGDGRCSVRIEPYRAAILLTGEARPPRLDVENARDVLYALLDNPTPRYTVQRCPDVEGAYLILPRPTNATPPS